MGGLWGRLWSCSLPASDPAKEFDVITHFFLFLATFLSCKMLNHKHFLILEGRYESNYIGLKD